MRGVSAVAAAAFLWAGGAWAADAPEHAVAHLQPTKGNTVSGTVRFDAVSGGVRVSADISGLSAGRHGFHVHENGDCSAPDATSAGGHFNPKKVAHGAPEADPHHGGDLGNVDADAQGHATLETTIAGAHLAGDDGLLGRGLIVHAAADDFKTQPTGNAGARVACGIIGAAGVVPAAPASPAPPASKP